jgi:hypothetical protein
MAKPDENVMEFLLKNPFRSLGYTEKLEIKSDGRPLPEFHEEG